MIIDFPNLSSPVGVPRSTLADAVNAGVVATEATQAAVRGLTKAARRAWFKHTSHVWPCVSVAEGVNPKLRISKENPPQFLHGFVADYDNLGKQLTVDELTDIAARCVYPPAAGGASLSGDGVHAIWLFAEPIPCLGNAGYARAVLLEVFKSLRAGNFLQGFDENFKDHPDRLLSIDPHNFGWLTSKRGDQVVDAVSTRMWASAAVAKVEFDGPALDLKKVHEHVERLFPGRWAGPFDVGCRGVRFWDHTAADATAAVITPAGVVYFSDGGGFRSWASLIGRDGESRIAADSLAEATREWHYDGAGGEYVLREPATGEYLVKNRTQALDRLEFAGLKDAADRRRALIYIEDHKRVAGIVALANQPKGVIRDGGLAYINVTRTQALTPVAGDCSFILGLIQAMFGPEQEPYFLGWLKESVIRMQAGKPSYAQALFMAGDVQSGKSLLQYRVLTPLFGGQSADPMPYLLGDAGFNAELGDAGHWLVSDREGARNYQQKGEFTQKVKAITANPEMSVHAKYRTPVTLHLNSRITFSFNRLSECLEIMPRLGSDIVDKIMLFDIQPHQYLAQLSPEDIEPRVAAELPAFAQWLLDYDIPPEVRSKGRYPVRSYHHVGLSDISKASQEHSELVGWLHVLFNNSDTLEKCARNGQGAPQLTANEWLRLIGLHAGVSHGLTVRRVNVQFQSLARQFPGAIVSQFNPHLRIYKYSVDYDQLTHPD